MSRTASPPQAPEIGALGRVLGPFHVTGVFWFRVSHLVVSYLPHKIAVCVAWVAHLFFLLFLWRIRRAVASNLEVVLGPCSMWARQRRIRRTFWEFALHMVERYGTVSGRYRVAISFEGLEHWNDVAAKGGGLIVATAHIGNWEVASTLPAVKAQRDVHLVRERELDPRAQAFQEQLLRSAAAAAYHTHFADEEGLAFTLLRAVRSGAIVALQGDRPRTGGKTVQTTIFRRPFPLPSGLFALARGGNAPILPVFVFRIGHLRYRVVFRPPTHGADDSAAVEFAREIEWAVRQAPHQWFCWRELWPQGDGTKVPRTPSATVPPPP